MRVAMVPVGNPRMREKPEAQAPVHATCSARETT
jgi:hypothetical protein